MRCDTSSHSSLPRIKLMSTLSTLISCKKKPLIFLLLYLTQIRRRGGEEMLHRQGGEVRRQLPSKLEERIGRRRWSPSQETLGRSKGKMMFVRPQGLPHDCKAHRAFSKIQMIFHSFSLNSRIGRNELVDPLLTQSRITRRTTSSLPEVFKIKKLQHRQSKHPIHSLTTSITMMTLQTALMS